MAGADAEGRCGGRRAAAGLLALALTFGCSAAATHDEGASAPGSLAVPPPPAAAAPSAPRAPQTATRIDRISIESAPPTTRVVLQLDGSVEPEVSLLENRRLVIDVPNTTCATLPRIVEGAGDALVERVRTGQHGPPENKSRIVIDLRQRADFSVRTQGDRIVAWLSPADAATAPSSDGTGSRILFGAESGVAQPAPPAAEPAAAAPPPPPEPVPAAAAEPAAVREAPPPPPPPAPEPSAERVPLSTSAPTMEPIYSPSPEPIEPTPAPTPELLTEATAPPYVEATPAEALAPAADATPMATSFEPALATPEAPPAPTPEPATAAPATVEPTSRPTEAPTRAPAPARTPDATAPSAQVTHAAASKRISIDFTEADVRTVIELIASAGGYKVLFAPEVGGTVTISLVDRPWEDALATVLRAKRLREVRHEDVMLIAPAGR